MEKTFEEGQRVYVAYYSRSNHLDWTVGMYAYPADYSGHYVTTTIYREERTCSFLDAEVYGDRASCIAYCQEKNAESDWLASLTDEEYNDYDFEKRLGRVFDHFTVQKIMSRLRKLDRYGDVEIRISNSFTDDGNYGVYWRYFDVASPIRPLQENTHKRETKAERKARNDSWINGAKERFLSAWTPLEM